MKRDYLLLALLLVGNITFAQSPIERALNTINRSSAEATINFLAVSYTHLTLPTILLV